MEWNRSRNCILCAGKNKFNDNGKLKNTIGGSTYYYQETNSGYSGWTKPNDITFYTKNGNPSPTHNINHEVGHLINFKVGNYFVNDLENNIVKLDDGSYLMGGPEETYKRNSNGYANK